MAPSSIALGMTVLAMVAYGVNGAAYVSRVRRGMARAVLVGSALVITGYLLVAAAKAREAVVEVESEDHDKRVPDREREASSETLETIGYGSLALFFLTSLFMGTNVTLQFYDPLAAVGYAVMFVSAWFPVLRLLGAGLLVLYYIFGAMRKVGKTQWTDRAQLIGRIGLATFYAGTLL